MRIKTIFIILVTILLTVVIMQNTQKVEFTVLFTGFYISKLFAMLVVGIIAFILGWLAGRPKRITKLGGNDTETELEQNKSGTLSNEKTGIISANAMKTNIGFIGLGNMGVPMAKNLLNAGYHLQVYNRTPEKIDELGEGSVTKCQSPAEAADGVDMIITMLSEDDVLKDVVLGDDGLLKKLPKNGLHISMSTISPDTAGLLYEKHSAAGSHYLAAPVFGRPEAAAAKKLWICVSGDQQSKDIAKPVLENLGQGIVDFGEDAGGANVVKIAGNFMIMASLEIMAEAFTLAEKNGLDRLKVAEFFGSTIFNAPIYQNYGRLIANEQYQPVGFKAKLGYKDARLAFKLSQQSETPMPVATAVHNRLLAAVAKGWGETDWVEGVGRGVCEDAGV